MLRMSAGVSLCFTLLLIGGAVGGCSSESTEEGGKAGSGSSTAGSSSSSAGDGGTSAGGGGTSSGGSGGSAVGRAGSSGSGNTGSTDECVLGEVTCLDDTTAQTCDEVTGEAVTVDCVADLKEIGITSTGCQVTATGEGCDGTPDDEQCWDGATVFAICAQLTTEQYINVYINCWQNNQGVQPIVRCLAPFLASTGTDADCEAADVECASLLGEGGAGAGGAGG